MSKPRRAARCARSGTPPGRRSTSRRCKSLLALHPESAACDLRAASVCCCRKPKEAKNLDSLRQASHAAVHKHHGADDHGSREEHVERDRLTGQQPAQQHRHYGIDVGVGRNQSRRVMFHEPVVGGEGHDRAENDEITQASQERSETEAKENPRYSPAIVPARSNCTEPARRESADKSSGCPDKCDRRE